MSAMIKMEDNGDMIIKIEAKKNPYIQKLIEEKNVLTEQNLALYFGETPNYKSEVLMSKIEVLEEEISNLKRELEDEKRDKKFYKDKYYQVYEAIEGAASSLREE